MVARIEHDESLQGWMTQELLGVVESSWIMKRTELLEMKVKELVVKKQIGTTNGDEKNIMQNLDEVMKAHFDVEQEYEKFCSDLDKDQGKIEILEIKFDAVFSILKQKQGKLKKSIESLALRASTSTQPPNDIHLDETSSVTYDSLSENEIQNLAKDVKIEYESS